MLEGPGCSAKGSDLRRKKGGHLFFQDEKETSVFGDGSWDQRLQMLRVCVAHGVPQVLAIQGMFIKLSEGKSYQVGNR